MKFFRACATRRIRKNKISQILDADVVLQTEAESVQKAFQKHFIRVFNSVDPL